MKKMIFGIYLIFSIVSLANASLDTLQTDKNANKLNVFIDCRRCDMDFVRTQISYVNYVIDRMDADIHILITEQRTGSSGRQYTLTFIGLKNFTGINDTIRYYTRQYDTSDDIRKKMVQYLDLGLVRYISHTPLADNVKIKYDLEFDKMVPEDKWNSWVFRTSIRGSFNGQEVNNSSYLFLIVKADRITEEWKIRLRMSASYSEYNYSYENTAYSSYSRGQNANAFVGKSMTDHWSLGASVGAWASTYSNVMSGLYASPTVEYNLFPYSQSTFHELRIQYRLGAKTVKYYEQTIYDKFSDTLFQEALQVVLAIKQPWGRVEGSVTGSNYFHDFSKNQLQFNTGLSLRLFKGFSLDLSGGYSMIHDQLALPKRDVTQEELLLARRQLATQYRYWASVGFGYTFGSIFNNVVNPRFGN